MKANELRIGNLLHYGDRIAEVSSIYRTHFSCQEYLTRVQFGNSLQVNFKPITLTEEWLVKLGFEIYEKEIFKIGCRLIKLNDEFIFDSKASKVLNVKYKHQLQNLYFALTGEELTINNG